jgi:ectoine hydroxylase-related dioxygenase (phytanoyl-CoA dioxygenase family)
MESGGDDEDNVNLDRDGYTIARQVVSSELLELIAGEINDAFRSQSENAIETGRGGLVGGRNLMAVWQGWRRITDQPAVRQLIQEQVGPQAGLVRILYFDKPPGQSWSLSLHRDKTIAVDRHNDPATPFSKPTRKAGVPHVEATNSLLQTMLTLRLHVDAMCDENGPLVVVPESHDPLRSSEQSIRPIHCDAGDLFVMRPLLLHGSRASSPDTTMHRRVVHLEIAPSESLQRPYRWHQFASL